MVGQIADGVRGWVLGDGVRHEIQTAVDPSHGDRRERPGQRLGDGVGQTINMLYISIYYVESVLRLPIFTRILIDPGLSVSFPEFRFDPTRIDEYREMIIAAGRAVSLGLGCSTYPPDQDER